MSFSPWFDARMKVSLITSACAGSAVGPVFLPWLKTAGAAAWRARRATAVIVPQRSDGYFLKQRALAAAGGALGVRFITPGELRDMLARHLGLPASVPERAHWHLLLATALERRAGGGSAASPEHLLQAIDLLGDCGWSFDEAGPATLRTVVADFQRLAGRAGFQAMHAADRALLDRARKAGPLFASVFVSGFNGLHWPLWPLLSAAVHSAENATVCLTSPRAEAESIDAIWIGTWEETFGEAQPVEDSDQAAPFVELLHLPDTKAEVAQREKEPAKSIEFLAGQNTAGQARAVVAKALQFLADPTCERLGILFPAAGALSRRVAAALAERGVPHHDGLAHHAPGPLEDPAWPAWIELQENPRIPALLQFLRTHHAPEIFFGGLALPEIEDALPRVFHELLIDDLAVVAEYLAQHPHRRHAAALAAGLRALPFLPASARLGEFIEQSAAIFRALGWQAREDRLQELAADWQRALPLEISRRSWLRWLGETLVSTRAVRAEEGGHPYSRVLLLPCAHAESQSWTHLIAAGLNEGHWPPALEDSGVLGEEEIDALNRRIRGLNTRATAQGRQGEGHETALPGKALCLGPSQRRDIALRQFLNTLESASVAVAATAQLFDESAPDRRLNPSDFFTRLFFCARGRAISQETMNALQTETDAWLAASGLSDGAETDGGSVAETRIAFDARREAGRPFGEYEFGLRAPLAQPIRLAATAWENALKSPALAWMNTLLGVGARGADDETPWNLAIGQWVHQWLRTISDANERNAFAPLPPPDEIRARVRKSADAFLQHVREILRRCGHPLPDWWLSAWEQALPISGQLAERIAGVAGRTHLATEYSLPRDLAVALGDGAKLYVHGRIDLILATSPSPDDAWIVDYKTGDRKPLRADKLGTGDGLQLALYALALRELGTRTVGVSLLTPGLALDAPQLGLTELAAQAPLWRGLHRMQETGVFGMHGAIRDEYAFRGDYPLATLAIDEEILAEKWRLTHPDFAEEDAE